MARQPCGDDLLLLLGRSGVNLDRIPADGYLDRMPVTLGPAEHQVDQCAELLGGAERDGQQAEDLGQSLGIARRVAVALRVHKDVELPEFSAKPPAEDECLLGIAVLVRNKPDRHLVDGHNGDAISR